MLTALFWLIAIVIYVGGLSGMRQAIAEFEKPLPMHLAIGVAVLWPAMLAGILVYEAMMRSEEALDE